MGSSRKASGKVSFTEHVFCCLAYASLGSVLGCDQNLQAGIVPVSHGSVSGACFETPSASLITLFAFHVQTVTREGVFRLGVSAPGMVGTRGALVLLIQEVSGEVEISKKQ